MLLQLNPSDNYASMQQLQTQAAILRARLDMMRLDHPDRAALIAEFATAQGRLTQASDGVRGFQSPGFTS